MAMTEKQLAYELESWFARTAANPESKKRRWSKNPVGMILRANLRETGNWKNAPRGNPSAGFKRGWGKHPPQS
jgi:hypothetical protein